MSRPLPAVSTREVMNALQRAGFCPRKSRRHLILVCVARTVALPHATAEVRRGALLSILRQAGLTADEFVELLRK